jgi:hypothetical protein
MSSKVTFGSFKWAFVLVFIIVCLAWGVYIVTPFLSDPREHRVKNEIEFLQIGKRIAAYITNNQRIPTNVNDLKANGILSPGDLQFFPSGKSSINRHPHLPTWITLC